MYLPLSILTRSFSLHRKNHRLFSSIPLSHPIATVWAANTGLGKTLISAGLASSILNPNTPSNSIQFFYVKPVQTGFPSDSDSRFVFTKVSDLFRHRRAAGPPLAAANHVLNVSNAAAIEVLGRYEERREEGEGNYYGGGERKLVCKTLYAWREAVSPHLAVEKELGGVEDEELRRMVEQCLWMGVDQKKDEDELWCVIETAGGVASPGPSGTLQCDLYRPFRLPAILVGDGRLGGISGTISAYETLKLRGYDVVAILLEDRGLSNDGSLRSYLHNGSCSATHSTRFIR